MTQHRKAFHNCKLILRLKNKFTTIYAYRMDITQFLKKIFPVHKNAGHNLFFNKAYNSMDLTRSYSPRLKEEITRSPAKIRQDFNGLGKVTGRAEKYFATRKNRFFYIL